MRHTKAYSSSCSQIILVCSMSLYISLQFILLQPEITIKLKPLFLGFKVIQGHRCWHS